MVLWQIWGIAGIILLITEIFTPALFFLNLAFAAILVSVATYFGLPAIWQIPAFAVLSVVLLVFLRPLLLKIKKTEDNTTVQATYVGKAATVVEKITGNSGRITIYGEQWNAISEDGSEIEEGKLVVIVAQSDLTMTVKTI